MIAETPFQFHYDRGYQTKVLRGFQAIVPRADWGRVRQSLNLAGGEFAAASMPDGQIRVLATLCPQTPTVAPVSARTARKILETLSRQRGLELSRGWNLARNGQRKENTGRSR